MPIAPLDLQQLYMQQSHIGRMEHVRMAAKTIAMQSEDRDIHRDSYIKDSTVVKSENISDETKVKEKKDEQRPKDHGYMSYRKKNKKRMTDNTDNDEKNNIIEIEEVSATDKTKGSRIDFLG
ncbi:hypothetical protein BHAMNSH16_00550 [Brachyspira hampsonii]|uniref:Uncharacterized protein n=1 Tax=Brachyspira hampsonii TaxID=1287055 RepID=A0AAC9TR14_9SPIR|nr:hypothetical protein [Brachyspira hampsonii]ASJ20223.1 hypothetical protein BHAMNSH16_00550 [Brachyspira hampsonii]MBW5380701.1 hypothetical protein [Brachyspira hampsonii]MBW5409178.1 hypothetical protein [Brachyspira hampsonii]OEJ17050.1 hypothetical protein A9496_12130 [Brachyspira hampsonii]